MKAETIRANTAIIDGLTILQSKDKRYENLAERGYVQSYTPVFGGRFPVRCTGWALTHAGRIAYCESCK